MNTELKRRANRIIAEFDGWRFVKSHESETQISPDHKAYLKLNSNQNDHFPNYFNDPWAMCGAECRLPHEIKELIVRWFTCKSDYSHDPVYKTWLLYNTDPETRVKIFICAIGKWHELAKFLPPVCPRCDSDLFPITSCDSKKLGDWGCPSCTGYGEEDYVQYFWNWQLK